MNDQSQLETTVEVRKSLGAVIRAAREDKKVSVEEVASYLMLGQHVIHGLESGDYQGLPEIAYIRGYLVAYLCFLDKPKKLLDEFDKASSNQHPLKFNLSVARPSCSEDGWARCISVGLVVLFIAAIGLWLVEQTFQILESGGLVLTEETTAVVEQRFANESVAVPVSSEYARPVIAERDVVEVKDNSEAMKNSLSGLPAVEQPSEQLSAQQAESEPSVELLLRFSGESWVEINDADGKRLITGLYTQGQEIVLNNDNPPFSVVLGNADHVTIEYQGQRVGVSRETGQVARLSLGSTR